MTEFAKICTHMVGNLLSADDQRRKLERVVVTARQA